MYPVQFRSAARWLPAVLLVLLLLWLALPRLLGLAAERWLDIPGLENLHVDIENVGAGHARLREVRAVYTSAGGHRFQIALHDIGVDYSLTGRHLERLAIASGELDVFPGQATQGLPWPQLEWPQLPVSQAQVEDLRVSITWPERPRLEAHGNFRLQQTGEALIVEFRPDTNLLRMTASPQLSGNTFEIQVEWMPAVGPAAEARLNIARQPALQPARLFAQVPLPLLVELGRSTGMTMPQATARGTVMLKAEALLGELAGTVRALSAEAEFTNTSVQVTGTDSPLDLALTGKIRFAWQPSAAMIELQPGLRWLVTVDREPSRQANVRVDREFVIRQENGAAVSEGKFPFTIRSAKWGQWDGTIERVKLAGGPGLADWSAADLQLAIKGQLKKWQQNEIQVHGVQAAGDVALHWSRSAGLRSELALQVGAERLSSQGGSPLNLSKTTWKVSAEAAAKPDGDFWNSLTLHGEASSPKLKVDLGSKQTLTLGTTRLQLLQFSPARLQGAEGELLISSDSIRVGAWPSPDVRARLRLDGSALRADGTVLLQGKEVLRLDGTHELSRGCGKATLSSQQSLAVLGKLVQPRPQVLLPLDFQAGNAEARFILDWCSGANSRFDVKGTLQVRDAALGWERARVEALQSTLRIDGLHPVQGRIQLAAQRGELATGTPLTDLNVDLALAARVLTVHALTVKLLGGSVHSEALSLPWPPSEKAFPLEMRQIDLGQLLALFDTQGLSGSGQVGGVLPLIYRDGGLEIHDGQLNSLGAGTIKYAPVLSIPDNPGLLVLRNFHFRQLGMHVRYTSDGAYRTQATLEGNNPDFYNGYPIRLGLNINGVLPGMFRSALFSGDFNRHILEQLQSGKLE